MNNLMNHAWIELCITLVSLNPNELDIRLKWPNDIYANGTTKIGGLIINSTVESNQVICNVGCGINLTNSTPTVCIADLIKEFNARNGKNLPLISYERLVALIFTEIERLYDACQAEDLDSLYQTYYQNWLHTDQQVTILTEQGIEKRAKVLGIDNFGFLRVLLEEEQQEETVHPGENSFDMFKGLILPKV